MVCVQSIFKENLSKWAWVSSGPPTLVQWRAPNKISEETRIVDAEVKWDRSKSQMWHRGYHCTIPSYLSMLFLHDDQASLDPQMATQPNSRSRSTQICCPFIVFDIGLHEGLPETQRAPKWFAFYWRTELLMSLNSFSNIFMCLQQYFLICICVYIYIIISLGGWRLPKILLRACFSQTVSIHNFGITFIPLYFALT